MKTVYRVALIAVLGSVVFLGCSKFANFHRDQIVEVSMVQLIASPDKYDGLNVSVIGFYRSSGLENSAIYLTEEDAKLRNLMSSIFVTGYSDGRVISSEVFDRRSNGYVSVVGRFRSGPAGHMGLWPGEISLEKLSSYSFGDGKWIPEMPIVNGDR